MDTFTKKIEELIEDGWNINAHEYYFKWQSRVSAFLNAAIDEVTAEKFSELGATYPYEWEECRARQLGHLEGLALKIEALGITDEKTSHKTPETKEKSINRFNKVFIVHGHDTEAKETTARFIEKLGLAPVILHEQPNSGRTIIEKFEVYSDVGFAIVLLTSDDVGASKKEQNNLQERARQNVILELGYFMGKLGRKRVCALHKHGVEIPSDYQGVIYIEQDQAGAWKKKVAQELVQTGFSIDLNGLLQS